MLGGPFCCDGFGLISRCGNTPLAFDLRSFNAGTETLLVLFLIEGERAYASTIRIRVVGECYCEQTSVSKAGVCHCMFEHGMTRDRFSRFFLLVFNPRRRNSGHGVLSRVHLSFGLSLGLGHDPTGSIGTAGVVRTHTSEVKFLDRMKTNFCESIRQECLH